MSISSSKRRQSDARQSARHPSGLDRAGVSQTVSNPSKADGSGPQKPGPTRIRINDIPTGELTEHPAALAEAFERCRAHTLSLSEPLSPEDQMVQSMPDASPVKWHLAHTTWFFETFILAELEAAFEWFDEAFCVLFNSYYNGIGEQFPRPKRGMISRPGLETVLAYRANVEQRVLQCLRNADKSALETIAPLLVLGINHEQQHQELILTDVQHALAQNPTAPAYGLAAVAAAAVPDDALGATHPQWLNIPGGPYTIGFQGEGFHFDNEGPAHDVLIKEFALGASLVTQAEWLEFMLDGGYGNPLLWLSEGWAWRQAGQVEAPLYWRGAAKGSCHPADNARSEQWVRFTLDGTQPVIPAAPITHISYYEADAYARWAGCRLPTEAEWETAHALHGAEALNQLGQNWEWTGSAYLPYPGFSAEKGAVGEYNGKFMINQMVLRGGSLATPKDHWRPTYRNFFPAAAQWQFSGLRLAKSGDEN